MHRSRRSSVPTVVPALLLAALTLVAAAVTRASSGSLIAVWSGPALLVVGLLAIDAGRRRGWPSASTWVIALAMAVGCWIDRAEGLAAARAAAGVLVPLLACSAAVALTLDGPGSAACLRKLAGPSSPGSVRS